MIIFLDDDRNRINHFRSKVPSVMVARTAKKCIELLSKTEECGILFLDHDLGGEVYTDSHSQNCGMEVVRWIEKNEPCIRQIIVHSHNHYAAQDMVTRLKLKKYKVDYVPYIKLIQNLEDFTL